MQRSRTLIVAAVALALVASLAQAQSRTPGTKPDLPLITAQPAGPGADLQYDNGNGIFRLPGTGAPGSFFVGGNRFDVGNDGNPLGNWTLNAFSFQNGGAPFMSDVTALFNNPATGGLIVGFLITGVGPGLEGGTIAPVTGNGTLLGGLVNTPWAATCPFTQVATVTTPCDGVALDSQSNSINPLGFHGITWRGTTFNVTAVNNLQNRNAIFRVSGDNFPVELMNLSVDN